MASEKSVVFPVDEMAEAIKKVRLLDKRVVCISDMYLNRDQIESLLGQCGYSGLFDNCYVSSEYKLRKRTGRLFKLMLNKEGIPAHRWAHFGDNRRDDCLPPRKMGGRSYHFMPNERKSFLKTFSRLERLSKVHPEWAGAALVEMLRNTKNPKRFRDLRYDIGFWILGPVLANFIHRAIDRINQENIELVLFPAREGFVLQEIFQKIKPHALYNKKVRESYCFLTRKITFPASVVHIGIREAIKGFSFTEFPSIRTMLMRLGMEPDRFENLARKCGFDSIDCEIIDPFEDFNFLRFTQHPEFRQSLEQNHRKHYSLLDKYLEQLGFWDSQRVAIVDVGWQGTVQDALTYAFEGRKDWPRLFGIYMGFLGDTPFMETLMSSYEGILYHRGKHPAGFSAFGRFVQLFELSTRAPHPTAVGLRKDDATGRILPVFKDDQEPGRLNELKDRGLLTGLQAGIFDFVDAYINIIPFMEESAEFYSPFAVGLVNRFLRFPRFDEGQVFSKFYNVEDFGSDNIAHLSNLKFRLNSVAKWGKTFRETILWKEGLIASWKCPGMVSLYNLCLLLTRKYF